ncbi:MAG TPA: hypothetical protein H9986_02165 [Candidatus Prevotella stercoripullorum]|nr:hypothetical protein [Candidatus Prevotella stercoripullorum]
MKKFLMVALFAIVAVGASAQKNWTVWWGGNVANITDADSEFKALNIGVSYTAPIADAFDWSAGVSYTTKGAKDWDPGFIQLEGNAAWNFVQADEAKVGIFTGPYLGFMVADDDIPETNTVDFGWQGGVVAGWKFLSLKIGYEYGFCNLLKKDSWGMDSKPGDFFFRVGVRF